MPGPPLRKRSLLSLIPMFEAVAAHGKNPEVLLENSGIDLNALTGAALIDESLELKLITDALHLVDDPLLGLKAGHQVSFTYYGIYALLMMTAPTLGEAVRVGVQYQALSLLFSTYRVQVDAQHAEMHLTLPDVDAALKPYIADRDLAGSLVFLRELIPDLTDQVLAAGTARPAPTKEVLNEFRTIVPFDIRFDQPTTWVRFPAALLRRPQRHRNPWAHKLYLVQAQQQLKALQPQPEDVVAQIKQILDGYENHWPAFPAIARMLGKSERTLRRHLDAANTSYRTILDAHRKQRALALLSRQDIALNELADKLGYAEPASFLKAFRRWTGTTPKRYLKGEED